MLVRSFEELCNINEGLDVESQAPVSQLLEEACRQFGFSEILERGWFFRPFRLGGAYYRNDSPVHGDELEAPAIEQAYRRGYDQGYSECCRLMREGQSIKQIEVRQTEIHKWRVRNVQRYESPPGDIEKPSRNLFGGRAALSPKLRWAVFQRDGMKCVVCGKTAQQGVRLEVDHIHPVSKGGQDVIANLRTLCHVCNSGKSDSI